MGYKDEALQKSLLELSKTILDKGTLMNTLDDITAEPTPLDSPTTVQEEWTKPKQGLLRVNYTAFEDSVDEIQAEWEYELQQQYVQSIRDNYGKGVWGVNAQTVYDKLMDRAITRLFVLKERVANNNKGN